MIIINNRFRKRRMQIFFKEFEINSETKILDIGGHPSTWQGTGFESNVTILNINIPKNPKLYQNQPTGFLNQFV